MLFAASQGRAVGIFEQIELISFQYVHTLRKKMNGNGWWTDRPTNRPTDQQTRHYNVYLNSILNKLHIIQHSRTQIASYMFFREPELEPKFLFQT